MKRILLFIAFLFSVGLAFGQTPTQIQHWQIKPAAGGGYILFSLPSANEFVDTALTASLIPVVDAGGHFTGTDIEAVLQELGAIDHAAVTLGGGNSTALTLSGQELTLSDSQMEINLDVDDLKTLSGVAGGSVNLGTFTGTTISDNVTIKVALQELETALESTVDTDNQTLDSLLLTNTTITLALEDDGEAPYSLDIRPIVSRAYAEEAFSIATTQSTVVISGTFPTDQDGVVILRNGIAQRVGASFDYTISGQTVTFNRDLESGEAVVVQYPQE